MGNHRHGHDDRRGSPPPRRDERRGQPQHSGPDRRRQQETDTTEAEGSPRVFRRYEGGSTTNDYSDGHRQPEVRDRKAHQVIQYKVRLNDEGRSILVVVNAPEAWMADRCWSTPDAPNGEADVPGRWYRAQVMVYRKPGQRPGTFELGIKSGESRDILSQLAGIIRQVDPKSNWAETVHTFPSDGNRVHWLTSVDTQMTLERLAQIVRGNSGLVLVKDPQAEYSGDRAPTPPRAPRNGTGSTPATPVRRDQVRTLRDGQEVELNNGVLARVHLGSRSSYWRVGERVAHVILESEIAGDRRWNQCIRVRAAGVEGLETLQAYLATTGNWQRDATGDAVIYHRKNVRQSVYDLLEVLERTLAVRGR